MAATKNIIVLEQGILLPQYEIRRLILLEKNKISNLLHVTNLSEEAQGRQKELLKYQQIVNKRLEKAPDGSIHIGRKKKYIHYYLRNESTHQEVYLPVSEHKKIQEYLQKSYDKQIINVIEKESKILKSFLDKYSKLNSKIREIFSNYPEQSKIYIEPIDMSDKDYIHIWMNNHNQTYGVSDNDPEYITDKGERVRSKSEINIANALYKHGIPYQYEYPIILKNGVKVHPDFTVLDVKRRKTIYWEHRGMMDDVRYCLHTVEKIKEYNKSGIVIGDNLIVTEENSMCPLGTGEIERVIKAVFG